jgi:Flp pilus assembly protein CpaB
MSQTVTAKYGVVKLDSIRYQVTSFNFLNGRTILQESFRLVIVNQGTLNVRFVSAEISSYPAAITVVDGKVTLGNINAGASLTSSDTCTVKINLSLAPNPFTAINAITWKITYMIGTTTYTLDNVPQ